MKHYIKSFALIALMCSATMLNAQTGGDTIKSDFPNHSEIKGVETLDLPVFSGAEQDLQDSLQSVGAALTDTALKSTVLNAVKEIKNMPKGGTVEDWIVWVFGALAALFGVYQYISKRLHKQQAKQNELKLGVLVPALKLAHGLLDSQVQKTQEFQEKKSEHSRPSFKPEHVISKEQSEKLEQIKAKRPPIADSEKDEAYVTAFNKYTEVFGRMPMDNLTTAELEGYIKRHENKKK